MTRNKVMKLWTAVITAFITLFTTLGIIATASAAAATTAVPQTETARNTKPSFTVAVPAMSRWAWSFCRTLPPTMKQRVHAEAHGSSPSCRHRPLPDANTSSEEDEEEAADSAAPHTDLT
jgi:hypothetical protein